MSTPPPVDSPALVLSDDPRIALTAWQDVDWLPTVAIAAYQRARIRGGTVEFAARFTLTSGYAQKSAVVPADMRLTGSMVAYSIPITEYATGAHVGSFNVNSSGTVQVRSTASSSGDVYLLASWPTA